MIVKTRIELLRLAEKLERNASMKKIVTVDLSKKNGKKHKKGEKPIETMAHRLAK